MTDKKIRQRKSLDEARVSLPRGDAGTETIDLKSLFAKDVTDSGSFAMQGEVWTTTFGKLLQALPIPVLLIDQSRSVMAANQAWRKVSARYEMMIGKPFAQLFANPSDALQSESLVSTVLSTRKTTVWESLLKIDKNRMWGRLTFRSIRTGDQRLLLVLVEDLSLEKKQNLLDRKYKEELEKRVNEGTEELRRLNEQLLVEITGRKRSEEALRRSEERFKQVAENAGEWIWEVDVNGMYRYCSSAVENILGYSPDELVGQKHFYDLFAPEVREDLKEVTRAVFERNKPFRKVVHPKVHKNGRKVILETSGSPVQDEQGTLLGYRGACTDITERKDAEEVLRESEEKYRILVQTAHEGIHVAQDGILKFVNPALAKLWEYSKEELLSRPFTEFLHPDDRKMVLDRSLRRAVGEKTPGRYAHRILTKDGKTKWVEINSAAVSWEGKPAVLVFTTDITERKQAEASAREHEERYRVLVENLSEGVFVVKDGVIQLVNSRVVEITGYSADELTFGPFLKFVHPDDREMAMQRHMNRMAGDDEPHQFSLRILGRDGRVRWLLLASRMILWHGERASLISATDITSHKEADEALRESEELLSAVLDALPDVVGVQLPDHTITRYNRAGYELLGLAPEEAHGRKCYELIGRSEQCQPCATTRALKSKRPESLEKYIPELGRYLWCTSTPLLDPSGEVRLVIERLLDITERKKAEVALAESEQRFRAVFNNDHAVMLLIDPETGGIEECSPGACSFYGYNKEDLTTKKLSGINTLPPEQLFENIQAARTGQHYFGDFQHRLANGEIRDVEVCSGPITAGGRTFLFSVINDVTERKKAEVARREREAYLKAILNNVPFLIWLKDREGRFLAVNEAFAKSCGRQFPEALVGKTDLDVWPIELAERYRAEDREVMTQRLQKHVEEHVFDRGDIEWLEIFKTPILDEEGNVIGTTGFARDITGQKELSKQLFQAQKMEAIGTLAGGVAHDFNNILQVALGYSELILGDEGLPQNYRADLTTINESVRRGADLVQRLLTFSRKTEIRPQPLDLNRRISELKNMLERTIQKMIDIQLVLSENLATINADPIQIDQVLMNLAVNARDAMPDGGRLIFETANIILDEEYDRRHLDARAGHHVLLTVTDTGSGMDKETQEHIFEPFYTTKAGGEGTGLGLSVVHGIVKQHGGHIRCYSEAGEGTTFKIYIPAFISEEEEEGTTVREIPRGGTETILLVEDEEIISDLGSRILTKAGYRVMTAPNGREALEAYRAHNGEIALVVLDLIMPEMGGRQCLAEILKMDPTAKVVIASGFSANGPTKDALSAGAKEFVNKPYEIRQVLEVVREVLDAE